jgi:DNA-3-methyladenine glycosylase II
MNNRARKEASLLVADRPTYDHIRQLTSPWHPYAGVVYFHLLLEKLRANGVI